MIPIATTTLTSAGSITFSSIPQTYTHLQIRFFGRSDYAAVAASTFLRFNGDAGTNYVQHYLTADGASVSSTNSLAATVALSGNVPAASATSSIFGNAIIDILDYTNTNKNKTVRAIQGFDNNGSGQIFHSSSLWLSTTAISSILLVSGGGANFIAGTRADLYGLKASGVTGA